MAIACTSPHANGSNTDATSYTTDSYTPTANTLQLLAVLNSRSGAAATIPTVTGNSLTWVQVVTAVFAADQPNQRRITVFRALGASPSTGTCVIDFAGVTQTGGIWQCSQWTGMSTAGSNGSDAVVQSPTAESLTDVTTLSVNFAALRSSNSRTFAACGHNVNEAKTPRTNWTELRDPTNSFGLPTQNMTTQWSDVAGADTTASASWATAARCLIIGIEVGEAAAAPKLLVNVGNRW